MKYFINEKMLDVRFNNKYIIVDGEEILYSKYEWFNKKIKLYNTEIEIIKNAKVCVKFDSASLGDNLAWMPSVYRFALDNQKDKIDCFTFFNYLFEGQYENINFVNEVNESQYDIVINIGCYDKNTEVKHKTNYRHINLQQVACERLGVPFFEERPKLNLPKNLKNNFSKKYVCIGMQSTSQCKYWNNEEGWRKTVSYLKNLGYDVVCIDKHSSFGLNNKMNFMPDGCIDKTGNISLIERINDLMFCDFFIGLGSGLSWLAWALNKPVIMISGFSNPVSEFTSPYRVFNPNVCNSCWNDETLEFSKNDWMWCPRNKDFECSKSITFDMVKNKIDLCIKNNGTKYGQSFNIKAAHILVDINSERESKSINSMKNIEPEIKYIQCINKRYTGDDWKKQVPLSGWRRHNAGHYGAFQSFKKAILENLKEDIDGLLIFECDCVLDVSKEEFIRKVNEAMIFCKKYNLPYFSFGPRVVNNYLESQEIHNDPDFPDFIITNNIILAHCILLNGSYRDYIFERLNESWDSPDLWFNQVFVKYSMGIVKKELAYQTQGMSMLDNHIKGELR